MPKAKKATKVEEAPIEAAGTGVPSPKEPKKPVIFKHTGNEPAGKLAPQAAGIVNILKEAGDNGLSREDLVTAMEGVITSRQPLGRILAYYQKTLVASGAVEMIEAE